MASLARREGFLLAPHGKVTMCPELFRRQLDEGAWGITVANVAQARVAAEAGAERILIANEVLARPDAAWIASVSGSVEVFCLVDSVDGVRRWTPRCGPRGASARSAGSSSSERSADGPAYALSLRPAMSADP